MTKEMWSGVWSMIGTVSGLGLLAMFFALTPPPGRAQDANERTRAAAPYLAEDLHNAQDQWALCRGDVALLKQQLADAKAELEKLKAAPPK